MDKRSFEGENENVKRQKLDELSESGPLSQEDVVYFQKEAIYRQMSQYKAKVGILTKELKSYSKEYEVYKARLVVLNGWTDQIVALLQSLLNKPVGTVDILSNELSEDEFVKSLESKKEVINGLLSQLINNLPSDVKDQLIELNRANIELKNAKSELISKNELINKNYKDINDRYLELLKSNDRLNSVTIKRINEVKQEEEKVVEVKEEVVSNDDESLKLEINKQNSFIKTQENIINDQLNQLKELKEEISKLNKNNLNVNDIKSSVEYQQVFKEFELLKNQNVELSFKYDSLLETYQLLEKSSNELNNLFNENFKSEKEKIISQFENLEKDLVRIRTSRDELLSKVSILESEKSSSNVIIELKEFLDKQNEIIESLNFKEKNTNVDDTSIESLQKKNSILTQELESLENAFKSISNLNFKKVNNLIELEQNLNKFKIEKQKADQKYFSAMRSKDSILLQLKNLKDLNKNYELKLINLQDLKSISIEEFDNLKNDLINSNKLIELKQKEIDLSIKQKKSLDLKHQEILIKFDTINKKNEALVKENSELINSKTLLKLSNEKLNNSNEVLNKQLDRYKTSTSDSINQEELEQYRSLIYCSLCSKNWKNTAITQCGHVFCESCTKERLDARMRKCPTCNKPFSYNDLLTVHL